MRISKAKKEKILAEKDQSSIHKIAKRYDLPISEIKNIINASGKKNPKWFYTVLILLPILLLILLEVFLRQFNYGYNLEQWVDAGEGKYIINPDIGRRYFTTGDFNPNTNEDQFDQNKKYEAFRVFVLGGSSAQGYPFNPMGAFSRYIRKRLELTYPNTKIEVVNISMTAVNTYTILDLLPGVLEQHPDLILVYSGHNEYYGILGAGSVASYGSSRFIIKSVLFLNNFKLTQFVRNTIQSALSLFNTEKESFSGTLMSRMAKNSYIHLDSREYTSGVEQFHNNMRDIIELLNNKGVPLVIGRLVSNLKDQKPFISYNSPGLKTADQIYNEAIDEYQKQNYSEAALLFRKAKDLDALRFRAPEEFNEIIDELGQKYNIPIAPIDSAFFAASPGGIVGDNLIVDHLHPNVEGYKLMGRTFYESMQKNAFVPKEEPKIDYNEQDRQTRSHFVFTELDSIMGNYFIKLLKSDWPYVKEGNTVSDISGKNITKLFSPKNFIDSLAMIRIENKVTWIEAHLIAATYFLRKDNLEQYLNHMNVLMYQYPYLRDLDFTIRYFYEHKKINLADYTPKRNGLLAMLIGNYDNAIRHLTQANKDAPSDTEVMFNLSKSYLNTKDYNVALDFINKCLTIDFNYPEAKMLRAEILRGLKSN